MIVLTLTAHNLDSLPARYRRVVFLDDDYAALVRLRTAASARGATVETLRDRFDDLYTRVRPLLVQRLVELGASRNQDFWWSGQIASRSSTATNLVRDTIYAVFARDLVADLAPADDLLFVCADMGLLRCLARHCRRAGHAVRVELPLARRVGHLIRRPVDLAIRLVFILRLILSARLVRRILPLPAIDPAAPRVLIRSWMTAGTIASDGSFCDRNFGRLPDHLRSRGYDVLFLPMMFNLGRSFLDHLAAMHATGERFVMPQHFVGPGATLSLLCTEARRWLQRFPQTLVDGIDVAPILRHENRRSALDPSTIALNLVGPTLAAMARRGIRIDAVLYPFENNAPEKPLLLAARRHYPAARLIAHQHSVWLSRQAGAQLIPGEAATHPLPDRIVCSGPVYTTVLADLGFPPDRLLAGPSLRFGHIRSYTPRDRGPSQPPVLFLALPFHRDASFEILDKLRAAIADLPCHVRVKPHPLLNAAELDAFVATLAFPSIEMVAGDCRDEFLRADVALNIGTSVAQMEAVACGVPLIRVVPDNTFFLDPMAWMDYPLEPVATPEALRDQIRRALALDPARLADLARAVKRDYFGEVTDSAMTLFLEDAA